MERYSLAIIVAALLLCLPAAGLMAQGIDYDPIDYEDVSIVPRLNYEEGWWLLLRDKNTPVGYAKWDPIQRRYTLFNLKNEYKGFYQATLGQDRRPDYHEPRWHEEDRPGERYQHYEQYLTYDKDNRYRGVIILTLGGRPALPDIQPFGELGGDMVLHLTGNIPVRPRTVEPFVPPYRRMQDLTNQDLGLPPR